MEMTKLNTMGMPINREQQPRGSVVNVNYGHNGGGKMYSYIDPKGSRRAGDEVVVEVTNKAGKTYKTLGLIRSTHGENTVGSQNTKDYLSGESGNRNGTNIASPVAMKSVVGGSQNQLPGYKRYENEDAPVRAWRENSKQRYDNDRMQRVDQYGQAANNGGNGNETK